MSAVIIVDERTATPDAPFGQAINRALDAGCRARLRPDPPQGFYLVRNGPAILATNLHGEAIGTYGSLLIAVHAWRVLRGVAEPIFSALPPPPRRAFPAPPPALFLDEVDW